MAQERKDSAPKVCIVCLQVFKVNHFLLCVILHTWERAVTKIWWGKKTCIQGPGFMLELFHVLTHMLLAMTLRTLSFMLHTKKRGSVSCLLAPVLRGRISSCHQSWGLYGPASPTAPVCVSQWEMPLSSLDSAMLVHVKVTWAACQTEISKLPLRGSDCTGAVWAPGVWIFASYPDQSQDEP